ncbi:transposase [Oligoflexus tunisiensis]|uniref:transposase n=1 Tax=Oligoflexus tunisiensis TaxID=708132 RepID=UPI00114CFBD5
MEKDCKEAQKSSATIVFADESGLQMGPNLQRTWAPRAFIEQLKQNIRGQIRLVWDRLLVHRSKKMLRYLNKQRRVEVHYLPAYAPEQNPVEYIWAYLKNSSLCNRPLP